MIIEGRTLSLDQLAQVALYNAPVALSPASKERMLRSRAIVEAAVERAAPVYGINTGFGKLSEITIPAHDLSTLQRNLVRSHAAGVGDPLPKSEVRAMMLLRANVLASGFAGARPVLVELLMEMLNRDLVPRIPEQGSVGASGDLAPLAHLALVLIGEGEATYEDVLYPGGAALAQVGLTPIVLAAKEGLALINGTQAHTAVAALACLELTRLWRAAHVIGAMTLEALLGSPDPFDARIQEARGQPGQIYSATLLRALLTDSAIRESHRFNDDRVQDAYALRCMPQVHGPAHDALLFARGMIERELNAATDNPLVLESGELLSGGNFHGQVVGMAADVLAIASANLAVISERRTDRLVHPDFNQGLRPFLALRPGLESGLMMAQVTAAALTSDLKRLASPASVDSIATDGNKEDVVPMAMGAALKLRQSVRTLRHVLAVELLAAADGLDARHPLASSAPIERAHSAVRALVTAREGDRPPAPDITVLANALAEGVFDPDLFLGASV